MSADEMAALVYHIYGRDETPSPWTSDGLAVYDATGAIVALSVGEKNRMVAERDAALAEVARLEAERDARADKLDDERQINCAIQAQLHDDAIALRERCSKLEVERDEANQAVAASMRIASECDERCKKLEAALEKIAANGPVEEPGRIENDNSGDNWSNGFDIAKWHCGRIAREALASLSTA